MRHSLLSRVDLVFAAVQCGGRSTCTMYNMRVGQGGSVNKMGGGGRGFSLAVISIMQGFVMRHLDLESGSR